MNERNTPSYSNKVVDLKPRGEGRVAHSQFGHFVPDEELLQSTARIKNQRDVIRERLQKMNTSQTRVSKGVYDKVRRDYTLQLETINELLLEKKQLLKEEIKKLYVNREKLSFEINRHREILEEAEFRHFLNEFTQSQYQEVENFETKEIEKLEADLAHISQWIRTHEDLFDPEDFGHKRPGTTTKSDDVTKTALQPEPQREATEQKAPLPAPSKTQSAPMTPTTRAATTPPQSVPAAKADLPPVQATAAGQATTAAVPSETAASHAERAVETFDREKAATPVKTEDVLPPTEAMQSAASQAAETDSQADDFSHLFSEDKNAHEGEDLFGSTENNIKALLESVSPASGHEEETTPLKARIEPATAPLPEPKSEPDLSADEEDEAEAEDELALSTSDAEESEEELLPEPDDQDYFKQEKVSEASFRAKSPEEESVTAAPQAKATGEISQTGVTNTDRQVMTPDPEKPVSRDDSISNILDSIRLDDDDAGPTSAEIAAASAAIQTEYKLILLQGDLDDKVFAVKDNTAIGRSPSNDVVLKEPKVSRQHAAINKYNEHYILIDLKSSNGVYVNGAKVDECVLHAGDEISIGGYKFSFKKT